MNINPEDETSYTTQYQEPCLKYVQDEYCTKHRRVPVKQHERFPEQQSLPLCNGFGVLSIIPWSIWFDQRWLVLATGPGIPPAVGVWTAKTGRFGSRPVQNPGPLTLGGPNPDPYPSTRGFRRVWLDPSFPISGSTFRVSHLWSHSDMLLLIVK